ncbi:MAG TPA: hypothetical protein VM261_06460 [Kofleriaceae bacterium]|nr:hypothetical protein [Kofleriaceae bacterium]
MAEPPILQLPEVDLARLAVVTRKMLSEDLVQVERTTRDFLALLDIAYLVASADRLVGDEREGILRIFEQLADGVLDRDAVEHHFRELDEVRATAGRGERLGAAAGDLRAEDRAGAIAFAAAIAMTDGWLGEAELAALYELGGHLSIATDKAREQVENVIQRVEGRLR